MSSAMPEATHLDAEMGFAESVFAPSTTTTAAPSIASPGTTPKKGFVIPELPVVFPNSGKSPRWIPFRLWFNTYRKLFVFTITLNVVGIALQLAGRFSYSRTHSGAFILANLFAATLVRNELFGRLLYLTINTAFGRWTPLWFRLGCTSVLQHLGGIHSGAAISGFLWLLLRVVRIAIDLASYHNTILVFGILTNVFVAGSIASAVPWVRNTHHNVFEGNHRLMGWLGLLATWVFVGVGYLWDANLRTWRQDGWRILTQADFWFAVGMTVTIVLPWSTVRRVPVHIEIPSPKAVVLRFERGMQQGLLARISTTSFLEYHAFGIISEGKDSKYHYLIAGVQGDFTKSLVENPPTHIWTREVKFAGVSNTSKLYKRGIRICTGTGLGAALSTCLQSPDWYLIWIGSDQEKTFGPTISGLIHNNLGPERYTLWDSKKRGGRPNTMELIKDVYFNLWPGSEVVFITSNMSGNTEMMEGCKKARIPAFGTLWDF